VIEKLRQKIIFEPQHKPHQATFSGRVLHISALPNDDQYKEANVQIRHRYLEPVQVEQLAGSLHFTTLNPLDCLKTELVKTHFPYSRPVAERSFCFCFARLPVL